MDSLITAAARALAAGDPLGALKRVALRDDAPALALESLEAPGQVQSFGRGRARRWTTPPVAGFTTTLLLPAPLPIQ